VLPVVVTARGDAFVSGLLQEQFAVFDNGRPVPIDLFSNEDTPVTVGLVIDASGSMRSKIGEVMAASIAFAKSSNRDDELFVTRFNDDVRDAIADRPFLFAHDVEALGRALSSVVPEGRTALYDALMAGLDHLDAGSRQRKVLVLISDGGDNASSAKVETVLARARRSNVTIYTIGVYDPDDTDKNLGLLKELASSTGGQRFLPQSVGPLLSACERVAHEIRQGYTIGFAPPDHDGRFHRVRVQVAATGRSRVEVRTRPGYFAGGPTE
jgi:VWFA-related protein